MAPSDLPQLLVFSDLSWRIVPSLVQGLVAIGAIAFLALLKRWYDQAHQERGLNLPPGPKPWPLVGNLLQMGPVPHKTMAELTKAYGPIVFLKFGSQPAVITSAPKIANDILQGQDPVFSSRPQTICAKQLTYDFSGFSIATYGDHWRAMRRICVQQLLSTKRLESFAPTRREEARLLVQSVMSLENKEVDLRYKIESFAMNIITDMILGKKYFGTQAAGQPDSDHMMHLLTASFHYFGVLNISDFIPWLAPLDLQGYERNTKKEMMWSSLDVPVNISEWAMAELVRYPEIQQKLQREIDDVVGHGRAVQESDIANLPYLKCIVKEVFRLHPAGPIGVPRMNLEPAKLAGYDIPAFTYVMISNTELGVSSHTWPHDATQFRPERWEPAPGSARGAPQMQLQDAELRINPFGAGRRSCPGASMGSALVFLCVASLAQSFRWAPGPGLTRDDIDMRPAVHGLMPMLTTLRPLATPRNRGSELATSRR